MAEEDEIVDEALTGDGDEDVAAALEEAVAGDGEGDEELEPLADEMMQMMEEEGAAGGGDSAEGVGAMTESEIRATGEKGAGLAVATPGGGGLPPNLERLMDVRLTVTIELGRTRETVENVMEYGDQSLIELDRNVGQPVDVLVNGEPFARGEVVTVSENFGVRITELVNPLDLS
ncbi:MAG: flagellar motor switch protein FliN [Candidatus Latescibacterota bacterium]|nr:flagellar motor switch protein FliN [Candidatus Latescibacterota bacterium]